MTAERTKDLDVLTADGAALYDRFIRPGLEFGRAFTEMRDETAKAVRAEEAAKLRAAESLNESYRVEVVGLRAQLASRPPLSSSPVARAEVTEEVVKREWDEARASLLERDVRMTVGSHDMDGHNVRAIIAFARRIASLSSAPQDAAAVREKEREAYRKGVVEARRIASEGAALNEWVFTFERDHPIPAPRSVPLSDGSVVRYDGLPIAFSRTNPDGSVFRDGNWRVLLLRDTDTGADYDAVKSLASTLAGTK